VWYHWKKGAGCFKPEKNKGKINTSIKSNDYNIRNLKHNNHRCPRRDSRYPSTNRSTRGYRSHQENDRDNRNPERIQKTAMLIDSKYKAINHETWITN
jgi:hypothetical protein